MRITARMRMTGLGASSTAARFAAMLLVAACVACAGCASTAPATRVNFYRVTDASELPRRIVVLPFVDESGPTEGTSPVQSTFTSELMKLGCFDVVTVPPAEITPLQGRDVRLRGTYELPDLVEIAEHYGTDAVLLGTITDHRPYPPLRLGLKSQLVSTRTGRVLWSADAVFDTQDRGTRTVLIEYHEETAASSDSLLDWEVLLVSMDRFTRFACNRMVATLEEDAPKAKREDCVAIGKR